MEAKQHAPEQLRREVKTCFKTNEMETHRTHQNLWDAAKAILRDKFKTIDACHKEQEKVQIA